MVLKCSNESVSTISRQVPATISIGIEWKCRLCEDDLSGRARAALDIALGRGGDQESVTMDGERKYVSSLVAGSRQAFEKLRAFVLVLYLQ